MNDKNEKEKLKIESHRETEKETDNKRERERDEPGERYTNTERDTKFYVTIRQHRVSGGHLK